MGAYSKKKKITQKQKNWLAIEFNSLRRKVKHEEDSKGEETFIAKRVVSVASGKQGTLLLSGGTAIVGTLLYPEQ